MYEKETYAEASRSTKVKKAKKKQPLAATAQDVVHQSEVDE